MKRNLLLLLAIASTILTANAQWELQTNPLGNNESAMVGKIQFVSSTEGWISASRSGKLLHTTDGGNNWSVVDPFPEIASGSMSDPGLSMSWPSATHGFVLKSKINGTGGDFMTICDGSVLYKTANGGTNWTKQEFPKTVTTVVYSNNDLTGTWQLHALQTRNPDNFGSVSKWMYGTSTIDGTGLCTIDVTNSDGSKKTGSIPMGIDSKGNISIDNEKVGFLSADKSTLVITTFEDNDTPTLYVLQKPQTGTTYATSDLQGTWQMHGLSAGNSLGEHAGWARSTLTVDAEGAFSGYFNFTGEGDNGTYGSTLTIDANGMIGGMTGMAAAFHGYMSADKNTIYASMTGMGNSDYNLVALQRQQAGTTYSTTDFKGIWQVQSLVSDNSNDFERWSSWTRNQSFINSKGETSITNLVVNGETRDDFHTGLGITSTGVVSFNGIDNSNGFLSADKNLIITTMPDIGSGGYTFTVMQRDLSISGDIGLQVQFVDENTGWMTNYNPIYETFNIYKTTNGGVSWDSAHANAGGLYYFLDANNGWMIGSLGENIGEDNISNILHSTDGGTTWQLQASNIGRANAIQFSDAMNGWVVGNDGLVMHTSDGGAHWNTVTNTCFTSRTKSKTLFFLNANNGWIGYGDDETEGVGTRFILTTKDGGLTWKTESTPVTNSIFSISAWDASHVWFTSDYGQIAGYKAPKTLNITAGGLNEALDPTEKNTLKALVLTGTMDARDFKVLRDQLPELESLDLSGTTIVAYRGSEGTIAKNHSYPENTTPLMAMQYHSNLQHVTLPNNLISVGYCSFYGCDTLSEVDFPSTLQLVDSMAFVYCENLKQVLLPQNVKRLAYGSLALTGIEQITLNEGLTDVGDCVFQLCDSLKTINIPSTASTFSPYALFMTNSLESINVVSNNSNYCSINGVLYSKDRTHLISYPAAKSSHFKIPNGVTTIDTAAFAGNRNLISITIPPTVTEIASDVFGNCYNLAVVDIPSSVTKIGEYCFYDCTGLSAIFTNSTTPLNLAVSDSVFLKMNSGCTLYVPKGSSAAYLASEGWSHYLSRIKEYEKVTDVDGNVYHGIQIGTQTWLVENLRTNRYNNGNLIPYTPEPDMDLTDAPFANFGWDLYDDPANSYVYGKLYTWNAATDQRGICPTGYKIPSPADWQTLIDYVSSNSSTSTTKALAAPGLWFEDPDAPDDTPASMCQTNNESGLLIFPAGVRQHEGGFDGYWGVAYLWSSEQNGEYPTAYHIENYVTNLLNGPFSAQEGFSIRCVKDPNVAVETVKDATMDIYPIPASSYFRINGLQETANVTITTISGQVLVSKTITDGQHISVAELADGMYLVTIRTNTTVKTKSLIVRHGR